MIFAGSTPHATRLELPLGKERNDHLASECIDALRPATVVGALGGRVLTGLRGSEARGLRWENVDLEERVLRVRERVDQWGTFGPPKSAAGTRDIPMTPIVVNTLREWKLACPNGELGLVFPNGRGKVESHANILNRGFHPLQVALGIVEQAGERNTACTRSGTPRRRSSSTTGPARSACKPSWGTNRSR